MLQEAVSPAQAQIGPHSLRGKRVLVTGGTTGIGRATARLLAREGARLLIYGRHQEDLDDALRELQSLGEVHGAIVDQARVEEIERVFLEVDQRLGGLDCLINNAAVSSKSVVDLPTQEWVYAMQSDLIGYMKCAEQAVTRMRDRGGWIVNVGSLSAKVREENDVYVTAKMGVRGFSDSLAKRVGKDGIHVTLIEPGLVLSEMNEMSGQQQVEKQDKLEMILGEDIGRSIVFVLSQPERMSIPMMQVRPLMQLI